MWYHLHKEPFFFGVGQNRLISLMNIIKGSDPRINPVAYFAVILISLLQSLAHSSLGKILSIYKGPNLQILIAIHFDSH